LSALMLVSMHPSTIISASLEFGGILILRFLSAMGDRIENFTNTCKKCS